ncbi:hypothetical protein [Cytobacillus oceanisediminis]
MKEVYVDYADLTYHICKKTGLDIEVVLKVIDAQFQYLKEKGLVEL